MDYAEFIERKSLSSPPVGFEVDPDQLNPALFGFQADITRWALRRGRAAEFEDCGLGKTIQELEFAYHAARYAHGKALILAPLAVSAQTVREGEKFGRQIKYAQRQGQVSSMLTITNYERLDCFDPDEFDVIVLDESSILKAFDGKTRNQIIGYFYRTAFRLAGTATPAPNDFMELGNHAEFLGVMTRAEMLSMFFVHDGGSTQDWRLKGHAETAFWQWVCQWAVMVRKPSDIGHDDTGFILPPLIMHEHVVEADHESARKHAGTLFAMEANTLQEQRAARRASLDARVRKCAEIVAATDRPFLVWCELNDEGDALEKAIPGAVQVAGSDPQEFKEKSALDFAAGKIKCMVSKSSIFGFGMNFQACADVAFVGVSHSYEQFYQAIRRSWRFGQKREVNCHVITASNEGRVVANLKRKEEDAAKMADAMVANMRDLQSVNVRATGRIMTPYNASNRMVIPAWLTKYAQEIDDAV